jgi:hypothetical protein
MPSAALDETKTLTRVCFGSCYAPQFRQSHVWRSILAQKPDAFLYIGDNVYQRAENGRPDLLELREAYGQLAEDRDSTFRGPNTRTFRRVRPIRRASARCSGNRTLVRSTWTGTSGRSA